jgi:hypothetical protein
MQGRYLHTGQHKQNKRTQVFMPRVEFEPTIPVFERAKTVHALDRAATVIGRTPSSTGLITMIIRFSKKLPVQATITTGIILPKASSIDFKEQNTSN